MKQKHRLTHWVFYWVHQYRIIITFSCYSMCRMSQMLGSLINCGSFSVTDKKPIKKRQKWWINFNENFPLNIFFGKILHHSDCSCCVSLSILCTRTPSLFGSGSQCAVLKKKKITIYSVNLQMVTIYVQLKIIKRYKSTSVVNWKKWKGILISLTHWASSLDGFCHLSLFGTTQTYKRYIKPVISSNTAK